MANVDPTPKALPLKKARIPKAGEDAGFRGVGIVTAPAIERGFQAFASENGKTTFSIDIPLSKFAQDKTDKQILVGALMVPDQMIYRVDTNGEPYNLIFTKEYVMWAFNDFRMKAQTQPEMRTIAPVRK